MYTPAGQSVEWIRSKTTVEETMLRIMREADEALSSLGNLGGFSKLRLGDTRARLIAE